MKLTALFALVMMLGFPAQAPPPPSNLQAAQSDLKRMHVLLNQMQTNAAFVGSSTEPMRHQFDLEIEMWQVLLNRLDREVGAAQPQKPE